MTRLSLLLLAPLAALCACHVSASDGNSDENVTFSAGDNGSMSFNLPFAKGQVTLPQGMFHDGQIDIDGVKMLPGSKIHGFNMDAGGKGSTVHLAFNAPKSPDEVRAYYVDQFKQKGDDVTQSGTELSGKTKDGDNFTIDVQPDAKGSTGTITVQSKD